MWNLISVRLETMLVSLLDRCTVCTKVPYTHKSFWMHLMVLLDDEALVESCFGPFRDSTNLGAR
jgi:hypothetical protein